MYNIFQVIALRKAISVSDSFSICYSPLTLVGDYLEGNLPSSYIAYGKYWRLGQQISLSSLILLQKVGILPAKINTQFISDTTVKEINAPERAAENLENGLSGVDILMKQLFKLSGWETDILYFSMEDIEDDSMWTDIPSIVRNQFLDWLFDTIEVLNCSSIAGDCEDYFLWTFRSKRIYSSSILHKIFYNIVRFSDYYICFLPDNTMEVYVVGRVSESYDDILDDECDFSSIHLSSALYTLYYSQMLEHNRMLTDHCEL